MKFSFRMILVLMMGLSVLALSACGDDDDDDPTPAAPQIDPVPPTPTDADGFLVAFKSYSTAPNPVGPALDIEIGGAVAGFFDNGNTAVFVDGGAVTCEGETLNQVDNNSYNFVVDQTNFQGLSFDNDDAEWTVAGNGSVEAFSATYAGFPELGDIATVEDGAEVSKSGALTVNCNTISDADSVIYSVFSTDGIVMVSKGGSSSSHIFEAGDLSGLENGSGLVQVAAYKYRPETVNGKNYYLINEVVRTKSVNIVD